ncbi:MAG: DUF4445 domain-containing protein, partial [Actinobacteria bacterium]
MSARIPVEFAPSGRVAWVDPGTTVLRASQLAGAPIAAPCGGRGVCGGCGVRVLAGSLADPDAAESAGLSRAPQGVRLACRAQVVSPVSVRPVMTAEGSCFTGIATNEPLVAAVDLGTTSVSAIAVERSSGREVGRATVANRQASWGADVLSRLSAALAGDGAALQAAAEDSVLEAIGLAAGGATSQVERLVIAANPVMSALLAGADASGLAAHP